MMVASIALNTCEQWLDPASAVGASATLGAEFLAGVKELGIYVVFGPKAVGGVVLIESAHTPTYTGRWAQVARVVGAGADQAQRVAITGVHGALRARISETVKGDTVAVWILGV